MASFNDIMLSVGMYHVLYVGTTMFAETKSMVTTIIRYVIVSGALTSMFSIAGLTTFIAMPDNYVFLGIAFALTKVYVNSYLAMLNARKSIRNSTGPNILTISDLERRTPTFRSIEAFNEEAVSRVRGSGVIVSVDVAHQHGKDMLYVGNR